MEKKINKGTLGLLLNRFFSSSSNFLNDCFTHNRIKSLYTSDIESILKSNLSFYENNLPLFYQWLSGFIDGEGSFQINPLKNKNGAITKFSFMFIINLHIDDLDVLKNISKLLGIGVVTTDTKSDRNLCTLRVNKQSELLKLIRIIIENPLKGVKFLDFSDFVKAYYLYFNRDNVAITPEIIGELLKIKKGMNKQRTSFFKPIVTTEGVFSTQELWFSSKIQITDHWLLGLIEGEGSFHLVRSRLIPGFTIKMVSDQEPLIVAIKEYLVYRLGFDKYSLFKLEGSQLISVNYAKSVSANSKPQVFIGIENNRILYNYLLPYLKGLPFLTKKFKDYNDFTLICHTIYYKIQKNSTFKDLILKLSNSMNNFRLSSYKDKTCSITQEEIGMLLSADPITKPLMDGRLLNLVTNKFESGLGGSVFEIEVNNEASKGKLETILVNSLEECASVTGISRNILNSRFSVIVDSISVSEIEIGNYKIKRIGVFLG
uniref:Homing endonuclease LAGLIDADG domain-containing protein n=1 Tax=Chrysoporthe deuterocubensis TaxID=764597 RepID=A0A191MWZ3_9PEZI|nr:hypothetical protein [Chrysoporthe deuterocubensis]AMX22201.1 hypothetical protein [Chrysoporthe deuterocubensis]